MELVYSFATLVPLDGMNGVITQKTKHVSHIYALKMEAIYSFEFKAHTFCNIGVTIHKEGPQMTSTALPTPNEEETLSGIRFPPQDEFPSFLLYKRW